MVEPSNTGIVYILSNEAMPNYLKVGVTSGDSPDDVRRRMGELSSHTGVPRAFNCEYAAVVANYEKVEAAILYAFDYFRVNPRREFLEGIDPIRVKAVLKLHEIKDATPVATDSGIDDPPETDKPPRAERFRFSMVGIPVGETLRWADNPEIECVVANEKTSVTYRGQNYAISTLTRELKGWKNIPTGTRYWLYEGETLQERRERLERAEYEGDE